MKGHVINRWILLGFFLSLSLLAACTTGSGNIFVLRPVFSVSSLVIVEGKSTAPVSQEMKKYFEKQLSEALYEKEFHKGTDLKLVYRFIQCDPGSRFLRWLLGNGIFPVGKGTVRIQVNYIDSHAKEVSTIEVEGTISGGVWGGSFDYAIEKAAEQVVGYTIQKFK